MRFVGIHRDAEKNRAYLQVEEHPGRGFASIELSQQQLLTLVADAANMAQTLYMNPAPAPTFVAAEDDD